MATALHAPTRGLLSLPRAVLSVAAEVYGNVERAVVGDARVRTSQTNAWEAMCADRARVRARDDMRRAVAALAANAELAALNAHRSVGSSPRSSASQATLVSTRG